MKHHDCIGVIPYLGDLCSGDAEGILLLSLAIAWKLPGCASPCWSCQAPLCVADTEAWASVQSYLEGLCRGNEEGVLLPNENVAWLLIPEPSLLSKPTSSSTSSLPKVVFLLKGTAASDSCPLPCSRMSKPFWAKTCSFSRTISTSPGDKSNTCNQACPIRQVDMHCFQCLCPRQLAHCIT